MKKKKKSKEQKAFVEFSVDEKILSHLSDADFNAQLKPTGISLGIIFKAKNKKEIPAKIAVPLECA